MAIPDAVSAPSAIAGIEGTLTMMRIIITRRGKRVIGESLNASPKAEVIGLITSGDMSKSEYLKPRIKKIIMDPNVAGRVV